jgi:N-acetylglutamate synthase-like GNAT family acetyltransferase
VTIEIRIACVDDAAAACEVLRRSITELCVADHGNDPQFLRHWLANKTLESLAAWIIAPANHFYVAVKNGKIIGVAAMTSTGEVTLKYVSPDARFEGASKALLSRIEQKAAELGLAQCSLTSTRTAQQFYRTAGYREIADRKAENGVAMKKVLAPL